MTIYILRSDGVYVKYIGMTLSQIEQMLQEQGLSCELVDEATFLAAQNQ